MWIRVLFLTLIESTGGVLMTVLRANWLWMSGCHSLSKLIKLGIRAIQYCNSDYHLEYLLNKSQRILYIFVFSSRNRFNVDTYMNGIQWISYKIMKYWQLFRYNMKLNILIHFYYNPFESTKCEQITDFPLPF